MPRPAIALAVGASVSFLVAATGAVVYAAGLAVVGLLMAAAELAAATAIWLARGRPVDGDDDGGCSDARPERPRGPTVPEEYWRHWEEQFTSPTPTRLSPSVTP
jgi:hypothetical protein